MTRRLYDGSAFRLFVGTRELATTIARALSARFPRNTYEFRVAGEVESTWHGATERRERPWFR